MHKVNHSTYALLFYTDCYRAFIFTEMEMIFILPNDERKPVEQYPIIPRKRDRVVIENIGYEVQYVEFDYDDEEIRVYL